MKSVMFLGGSRLVLVAALLVTSAGIGLPERAVAQQPVDNPVQRIIEEQLSRAEQARAEADDQRRRAQADRQIAEATKANLEKKLDQVLEKLDQLDKRLTEIDKVLARSNPNLPRRIQDGAHQERTARVEGRVTIDGKPLAGATVTFVPLEKNRGQVSGLTNEDGDYHLKGGVLPGKYTVTVTKPKSAIPLGYSDPKTSPLLVEVSPKDQTLDLVLQSR
jgi:hypothetical protein